MKLSRWWVGAVIGVIVGFGVLFGLSEIVPVFRRGSTFLDFYTYLRGSALLVLLGASVAIAVNASRTNFLATAVPALLWGFVYGPAMFTQSPFPDWQPGWLQTATLRSFDVHIPLIFGLFAGTTIWNAWRQLRHPVEPRAEGRHIKPAEIS